MSPQKHEAIMQAEDPHGPPENDGASTGSQTSQKGSDTLLCDCAGWRGPMLSRNPPWTTITSRRHCEDEA
jgi:hypothetical protein